LRDAVGVVWGAFDALVVLAVVKLGPEGVHPVPEVEEVAAGPGDMAPCGVAAGCSVGAGGVVRGDEGASGPFDMHAEGSGVDERVAAVEEGKASLGAMAPLLGSAASMGVDMGVVLVAFDILGILAADKRGVDCVEPNASSQAALAICIVSAKYEGLVLPSPSVGFSAFDGVGFITLDGVDLSTFSTSERRRSVLGLLRGLGTLCPAIRFPITTKAFPTSSDVPCTFAIRAVVDPVGGLVTVMWAFEMVVASLRPRPSLPTRWPAMASGIDIVQSNCSALLCIGSSRHGGGSIVF
jgi:hypothetical protein